MSEDKMIDKVLKLLAKAESTTPEEAEALMAKAQEIMTRHAIDEAMLAAARGDREPDEIIERRIEFTGIYATSHRSLAFAVADGAEFRTLQSGSGSRAYAYWIGFKSEIEAQELLLTSLLIQAEKFQREFMKEWNADHDWATAWEKATARRSFLEGFAQGIRSRLVQARVDATKEAQKSYDEAASVASDDEVGTPSTSVALVLAGKRDRINDWVDSRYGKLRSSRARSSRRDWNAAGSGRAAAGRANLGQPGVSGSRGALGR